MKNKLNTCYYCGLRIIRSEMEFKYVSNLLEDMPLYKKFNQYAQKSREHLIKKCDGGKTVKDNIVIAHVFCNSSRQDKTPEEQKEMMKYMLEKGTHPLGFLKGK